MKYSRRWLNEFVSITLPTEELADKLSLAGLEVESIETVGDQIDKIYTGKIEKIAPHPDADKLVITSTRINDDVYQIVTGATNISEGDIVPVALPGSTIANGMTLKEVKLRGVPSFGMLCSETELGVSDESAGIWILPPETPVGVDFIDYAWLKDEIIEIGILPNRGDCQSILGLAREISALIGQPLKTPDISFKTTKHTRDVSIAIEEDQLCPKYTARSISNVAVSPSPLWMQRKLQLSEIRPINNLVDITNYVLLECGQPLHSFDEQKLSSTTLKVRLANDNEPFVTLDGENKSLRSTDLIVCDGDKPIALAGVMGGKNSDVDDNTTSIILEAAFFDPTSTRRTSNKHNLRSESSIRFEKTVDFKSVEFSSHRACHLYQTLCHASIDETLYEYTNDNYALNQQKTLDFSLESINNFLGSTLSMDDVERCLTPLGFIIEDTAIHIPSWRAHDIEAMPCIAEEIARVFGYDFLPTHPYTHPCIQDKPNHEHIVIKTLASFLANQGLNETNTFPMIARSDIEKIHLNPDDYPTLKNPLTIEASIMRPSLIPSLMHVLKHNTHREQTDMRVFEIAKTFTRDSETMTLTLLLTGNPVQNNFSSSETMSFSTIKGLGAALIEAVAPQLSLAPTEDIPSIYHPKQCLALGSRKETVGHLGQLHPSLCAAFDVNQEVYFLTLNVSSLARFRRTTPTFEPFSKFPSTRRDIAFIIPKSFAYHQLEKSINQYKHKFLKGFYIFDTFESDSIGEDHISLGIAFIYQQKEGTLAVEKVNKIHDKFTQKLLADLPVKTR